MPSVKFRTSLMKWCSYVNWYCILEPNALLVYDRSLEYIELLSLLRLTVAYSVFDGIGLCTVDLAFIIECLEINECLTNYSKLIICSLLDMVVGSEFSDGVICMFKIWIIKLSRMSCVQFS